MHVSCQSYIDWVKFNIKHLHQPQPLSAKKIPLADVQHDVIYELWRWWRCLQQFQLFSTAAQLATNEKGTNVKIFISDIRIMWAPEWCAEPCESEDINPFHWWASNHALFPSICYGCLPIPSDTCNISREWSRDRSQSVGWFVLIYATHEVLNMELLVYCLIICRSLYPLGFAINLCAIIKRCDVYVVSLATADVDDVLSGLPSHPAAVTNVDPTPTFMVSWRHQFTWLYSVGPPLYFNVTKMRQHTYSSGGLSYNY